MRWLARTHAAQHPGKMAPDSSVPHAGTALRASSANATEGKWETLILTQTVPGLMHLKIFFFIQQCFLKTWPLAESVSTRLVFMV